MTVKVTTYVYYDHARDLGISEISTDYFDTRFDAMEYMAGKNKPHAMSDGSHSFHADYVFDVVIE